VITQYIQEVISHSIIDRGLYIIPLNPGATADRVVLYGAQHDVASPSANRMKFRIFYTPASTHKEIKH